MTSSADLHSRRIRSRAKATLAILIGGAIFTLARVHAPALPLDRAWQSPPDQADQAPRAQGAEAATVRVNVTGDVARTGAIAFLQGTTLKGLLEAVRPNPTAYTAHADFRYILQDGDDIHVPQRPGSVGGRVILSDDTLLRIRIRSRSPISQIESPARTRLNLNRATLEELQTLPRIGPETARRIMEARDGRGGFKRKEDLLRVRGIGRKTYKWIEPLVTVE